jgi:hypothetical protein
MKSDTQNNSLIHSYLALRKAVGWIGILLPLTLLAGVVLIFRESIILRSISHYYYSGMRDVFVGALCAIALFLFFYRGHDNWGKINWDNWLSSLAGLFAIGIALFPTTESGPTDTTGLIHFVCAAIFFVILALFSMFIFTKKGKSPTDEKIVRNRIFRICGAIMLACLLAIFLFMNTSHTHESASSFVFWAESIALVAFGISWLTKGGSLYPDK